MLTHNGYCAVTKEGYDIANYWNDLIPMLMPAMEDNISGTDINDLFQLCVEGKYQLWYITKDDKPVGAMCSEVQDDVLDIVYIGGTDFAQWQGLMHELEIVAKEQGIKIVRICGRMGWAKLFPDYTSKTYIIAKQL